MLGLAGWFSTNILGNRDGEAEDPGSFKTKEESAVGAQHILQPELYPTCTVILPQGSHQLLAASR
jgi:myo-inositol-1-phosphate synthase